MNYTIYPLFNGCFNILFKSIRSMEDIHCFAFLVVDENGEAVLVDTGFDPETIPGINTCHTQTEEQHIKAAIEKLGFNPAAIKDVIMTHIHWDHTAGMRDFPQARFFLQADEFRGLLQLNPNEETYFNPSHWLHLLPNIKLIEGHQEIKPGLRVIQTGGHTSGHQLVEVQTKSGPVYLIGDSPFNYDLLWKRITPDRWQLFRDGVGKDFYWKDDILDTIDKWLKEQNSAGPIQSEVIPWTEIKKMGSRLIMSHDPRLLNMKTIG
ncbi:MAG TPA: MBL fold metallo-hydrolase [Syntrophomonadaceae bacterium]|nr:MBL fold metallo-hydrolase [Syntrophomonadaceae bacterium]